MAKKRANGEGNIRKRKDGRWEGRFTVGYDPDTGKAIQKNVLGKTQAEVREKLKEAIEKSGRIDLIRADRYTLGQWVKLWYEVYCKPNLRPSTARYYQMFIDKHIIPKLGKIKLSKLRAIEIQKFYNDLRTNGRLREAQKEKNPGLSASYVRGLHTLLHSCLDAAVREKLILSNPVNDCKPPKLVKKEMKALEPEQVRAYLKAADNRGLLPMFFLDLTTGMRKSELVALQWSDVDWKAKTISVSKQAYMIDGKLTVVPPKTVNSVRKIALSEEMLKMKKKQRAVNESTHPGSQQSPSNPYIFPSPVTGEMYHPDSVVNLHKKILKEAGLEHIRFHDLRHTFATLALQNGVDVKTVSAMLGHSNAGFTLATYTHTTTAAQHQAAAIMGSLVSTGIAPEKTDSSLRSE